MEDFREIVGFLIIGIGILLSVLKEKKDKNKSDSSAPAPQNGPIQRQPLNQQHTPRNPKAPHPQAPTARAHQHIAEASTLPFTVTKVRQPSHSQKSGNLTDSLEQSEASAYGELPEEGARVTQDNPQIESASEIDNQYEEELIEKLREGIILSEILKRKF